MRGSFNFSFRACASSEVNDRGAYFVRRSMMFLCSSAGSAASTSFFEMELYQHATKTELSNELPTFRKAAFSEESSATFSHAAQTWLGFFVVPSHLVART
jgi:hypothetical protein